MSPEDLRQFVVTVFILGASLFLASTAILIHRTQKEYLTRTEHLKKLLQLQNRRIDLLNVRIRTLRQDVFPEVIYGEIEDFKEPNF